MNRPATRLPVIRPGDVLVIEEADYCYGVGTLTLRVTAVGRVQSDRQCVEWLGVAGVQIRWDGSDGDRRSVLVRTKALPAALERGTRLRRATA